MTKNNRTRSPAPHSQSASAVALKMLVCAALAHSTGAYAADLTISLKDVRSDQGTLMLSVIRNEAQMNGKEPSPTSMMLSPNTEGVSVTLHDVEPGTYGVQVMHDVNGNGELDANMLGIPKEPWGFSNNAKGKFGPAKWKDVQFTIDDATVAQEISLNH